ncbi:phosphatase PhoE [soil metagenome]
MTLLYLVRHGETNWNRQRRIQGSTDIPLNDTGRAQAAATGRLLARRQWDGVYSSPLSRAFETGQIIAREVGIDHVEPVAAIVERHYGEAEGLEDHELTRLFPGDSPVPGREARERVADRAVEALMVLAARHPEEKLIVTTHGGVIRAVLNTVAPEAMFHRGVPIGNGSVHSFNYSDEGLQLVLFNDPIDEESERLASELASSRAADDFDEQNPLEAREGSAL